MIKEISILRKKLERTTYQSSRIQLSDRRKPAIILVNPIISDLTHIASKITETEAHLAGKLSVPARLA